MKKIHSYLLAIAALLVFAPGLSGQTTYNDLFEGLNFPADTSGFSEQSSIGFKKNISEPAGDRYWLKLEAYATGSAIETSEAVPSDVVLVLDLSSSMTADYNGQSRLDALKDATSDFVESIYQNAIDAESQDSAYPGNRIAIVTYSGDANIELASGWVDVKTGRDDLLTAISGFSTEGHSGTRHELALEKVITSLLSGDTEATSSRDGANLSVVMFTDGSPVQSQSWAGIGTDNTKFTYIIANNAIHYAYEIKNTYKATLFTVGLITEYPSTNDSSPRYYYSCYRRVLYLMDLLSSNYPSANIAYLAPTGTNPDNAAAWEDNGDGTFDVDGLTTGQKDAKGKYFQLVTPETDLSAIFQTIASQSGGSPAETFSEKSQNIDVVSSSFMLPPGTDADDIKVFTAPYEWNASERKLEFGTAILAPGSEDEFDDYEVGTDGTSTYKGKTDVDDAIMEEGGITVVDGTVTVTGFDYADNWCGPVTTAAGDTTGAQGHKVIIMIPIVNDPDAVGGPNVATNGPGSGIKDKNGDMLVEFAPPAVALPVNIQIQTTGLSVGESAKYSIKRKVGDGDWEYVTSVFVTRHQGQGEDDASVYVKGLPPVCNEGEYTYKIESDDWDWSYTLVSVSGVRTDGETEPYGPDDEILTDNFAVNPIIFNNSKTEGLAPKVRYSESKATNTFNTGSDEYDDYKDNGRTVITVTSSSAAKRR